MAPAGTASRISALASIRVTFTLKGWRPLPAKRHRADGVVHRDGRCRPRLGSRPRRSPSRARPVVDVHSRESRSDALSGEVVKIVPTVRSYNALLALVPGVVTSANDVVTGTATTSFPMHGGRVERGAAAARRVERWQPARRQFGDELCRRRRRRGRSHLLGGGRAGRVETAGLVMNIVPKAGGNTTRGSLFASGTGESLQSDNLTPALEGSRSDRGDSADEGLRRLRHARRTDRAGSRLVFRQRAHRRQHEGRAPTSTTT